MCDLTVLLATFRRAEILRQTLSAMTGLETAGLRWELLVVDNAGEEAARQVCSTFTDRLPLRYLAWTVPGKNAALNRGLKEVTGELVVLSDDDVLPRASWLQELHAGARRWPDHDLFGGRVVPHWPQEPPTFDLDSGFGRWTYGIWDPEAAEGPMPSFLPLGANMAVRRQVFDQGLIFNERIGPNRHNYAMGSETDLILRLKAQGHDAVFLPDALVQHIILPSQLEPRWLLGRAFRQGRGEVRLNGQVSWYGTVRLAKQVTWTTLAYYKHHLREGQARAFRERLRCSLARGRFYESLRMKLGLG
jgi:GT2 family glycosyltransferase